MASTIPSVELNTGAFIPAIGTGAWSGWTDEEHAKAAAWLLTALKAGFRHIDTAYSYGTEKSTGDAIRQSGIPREEIFVTTKYPFNHAGKVSPIQSIDLSLKNAGLDYYDLYLVHWPQVVEHEDDEIPVFDTVKVRENAPSLSDIWRDVEAVFASGKAKAIGVSNFSIKTLNEILPTAKVVPAVNQVEMHPFLAQNELVAFCKEKGIVITAYSPSGWSEIREHPTIVSIAKKHGATPTQVIMSWHVQRGTTAVPRSTDEGRQKENLKLVTLDEEDMKQINGLDRNQRICNKPNKDNKVWGWTMEQLGW